MHWTSQGIGGLPAWRDRVEESDAVIKERGGKLIDVYVTLGRYDVVEIFEAPNDETAYGIVLELARHGTCARRLSGSVRSEAIVLRAFSAAEEAEASRHAREVRPPLPAGDFFEAPRRRPSSSSARSSRRGSSESPARPKTRSKSGVVS